VTESELLEAVRRDRDSDGPRLVWADFLSEQGDARGEHIRIQCERAGGTGGDLERDRELADREEELQLAHGHLWRADARVDADALFVRGLPAYSPTTRDAREMAQVVLRTPIASLHLDAPGPDEMAALCATVLPHVETLELKGELPAGAFGTLCAHPGAHGLRGLRLDAIAALSDADRESLLRAPWTQLTALSVRDATDEDLRRLSVTRSFQGLRTLDLRDCPVGPGGARALARLPLLEDLDVTRTNLAGDPGAALGGPSLRRLRADAMNLGDDGAAKLVRSPGAERLEELRLNNAALGAGGAAALAGADLDALRLLHLDGNPLRDGATRLCEIGAPLRTLSLQQVGLTDAVLEGLGALPASIRQLDLRDDLSDAGVAGFLRRFAGTLQDFSFSNVGADATIAALAEKPPGLRRLFLGKHTSAGLARVAGDEAFGELRYLGMSTPLTDEDARVLAASSSLARLFALFPLGRLTRRQVEIITGGAGLPSLRWLAIPAKLPAAMKRALTQRGVTRLLELR
jgi:uncharacterized protein (TIGR02996 family)